MFIDLPLDQLRSYRPDVAEPADFDEFWTGQIAAARKCDPQAAFEPVDTPIRHADVFDVSFPGYQGEPVKAWLLVPRELRPGPALIVEYVGYNGGRGHPLDWLGYVSAGHRHLAMDTRAQGGGWRSADTADPSDIGTPSTPGFLTRDIADPRTHYYTRLFVDAARAVDAARQYPASRDRRIVTAGISQGGGLALATAHLAGDVSGTLADMPCLAHFRRAVAVTDGRPYGELIEYCGVNRDRVEDVFATLAYLDVVNHVKRIETPGLFSVGLLDPITPPSM